MRTVNPTTKCMEIGISIPKALIEYIDNVRGDVTRSRYIWRTLEKTFESEGKNEIGSSNGPQIGTLSPSEISGTRRN